MLDKKNDPSLLVLVHSLDSAQVPLLRLVDDDPTEAARRRHSRHVG